MLTFSKKLFLSLEKCANFFASELIFFALCVTMNVCLIKGIVLPFSHIVYGGDTMISHVEPTTKKNARSRLFFRFFLCYVASAIFALLLYYNTSYKGTTAHANALQCVFFALAALSAFTTVSVPLLTATTACKAVFDAGTFLYAFSLYEGKVGRILITNLAFFHLAASTLLFCAVAADAELFSHTNYKRNADLLLSRECLAFLLRTALFLACALFLYLLIPQLASKFR